MPDADIVEALVFGKRLIDGILTGEPFEPPNELDPTPPTMAPETIAATVADYGTPFEPDEHELQEALAVYGE